MVWRVRKADVDYFRLALWKDLRPFPGTTDPSLFCKECFTPAAAQIEALVLIFLRERVGETCAPRPVAVQGSVLVMERVRGVRIFDLIRHLKKLETVRRDGQGDAAIELILSRCGARLREVQLALADIKQVVALEPYPLEEKLRGLLDLFIRVLDIQAGTAWSRSLGEFADYWSAQCVSVPFRDATTKNMLLHHPELESSDFTQDLDGDQGLLIARVLERGELRTWEEARLVDIDFSSVTHLTSPEDDPISLFCHEWTFGSREIEPSALILAPELGSPDPSRAAASFVVRYLRFGGRKLAYSLINRQGFMVRFAYDDPLFYFSRLQELTQKLSDGFTREFQPLLALISSIGEAAGNPTPADVSLMAIDHVRRFHEAASYWQQNPLESPS